MKMRYIFRFSVILVFAFVLSCGEKKFTKTGWTQKGDAGEPARDREKMLDDLLSNYRLVGLRSIDLITLLGPPDDQDSTSLTYWIDIDYGVDIDPVHSKRLHFSITSDSVVSSYEIKEWNKD